jgi:hypothetical protein
MGRRSPESMVKRAREQALREKRELKQAKKDARAAARHAETEPGESDETGGLEETGESEETGAPEEAAAPSLEQ